MGVKSGDDRSLPRHNVQFVWPDVPDEVSVTRLTCLESFPDFWRCLLSSISQTNKLRCREVKSLGQSDSESSWQKSQETCGPPVLALSLLFSASNTG